jgi:TonB family protein
MNYIRGECVTKASLPKKYKRNLYEDIDKSFLIILLITIFFHFGTAGYFVFFPISEATSLPVSQKIQEQFTTLMLDRETEAISTANALSSDRQIIPREEVEKAAHRREVRQSKNVAQGDASGAKQSQEVSNGQGNGLGDGAIGSSAGGGDNTNSRQKMQQIIEEQVANQGILAILSTTRSPEGGSANDILSSPSSEAAHYMQVYDGISKISGQGGVRRTGSSGSSESGDGGSGSHIGARGGRSTQSGQIDTYISDLSTTQTPQSYLQKKDEFIVSKPTPITADESEVDEKPIGMGGARDIDKVTAIVISHSPAIQYCYERELKRNSDLKGKIAIRFTIDPAGVVSDVKIISSTLENENVERCILARVSRWDDFGAIDPSLGNTTFRQVYTFGF